jgi:hypothetical protein
MCFRIINKLHKVNGILFFVRNVEVWECGIV